MQSTSTPTLTESFGEVVCLYTDTLYTAQKQTYLTNTLLQDIAIFNEHNSTTLEEWLRDIETAADLTSESQGKLAKAKLRGLTHTLVIECINSEKKWDDIKDLLRLKLWNVNIHMYTSHFMDKQQQEKESLAAYVHQFKMEAKCCYFTNDAATIRIFIKWLNDTHSLAARIYEQDPQPLKDAITKVEKPNAAKQFTTTILPSSMVNMMPNEDDQCFQCQEPGHITWHCPYIRCHECEEYGHIVPDYPTKISPSGTPAQHLKVHRNCYTRSSSRLHKEDPERRHRSRSQSRYVRHWRSSHCDLYRGCFRSQQSDRHICYRRAQGNPIQHTEATAAELAMTHKPCHTTDNPHTAAHLVTTLRTAVGHIHIHPTDHQNIFHTTEDHTVQDHTPTKGPENHTLIGIERSI